MKKFLLLILLSFIVASPCVFANPQSSNNAFEIPIDGVPPGSRSGGHSGGLSGGAVTAIALGSVFGGVAALGGLGWYFAHKNGLAAGFACGCNSPYSTISMDDYVILGKLKRNPCENKYLIRTFEYIQPDKNSSKRYLLVQDLNIKGKSYNTIFFDLPESKLLNKVRIIQVSDPFVMKDNLPALDTKIITNPKSKKPVEIPTTVAKKDYAEGVLIKQGTIEGYENPTAAIVTENRMSNPKTYALIVEFSD